MAYRYNNVFKATLVDDIPKICTVNVEYAIYKENLMSFYNESMEPISGKIEGIEHAEWTLKMIKGRVGSRKHPTYYWGLWFDIITNIPLNYKVCIELASKNDSICETAQGVHGLNPYSTVIQNGYFVAVDDLNKKFPDDSMLALKIKAEFSYTTKEDQRIYGATKLIQNTDWSKRLQSHGQKDFKLIVGNEFVEIHKFFLTLESPVITTMLENPNFKETQTGEMVITDFKFNTVKAVVAFCYGEDISEFIKITENAIELLMFADKYDMTNLKASFEEYYSMKLTKGNVASVFTAAHKTNAIALKNKCISFIQSLPRIEKTEIAYGSLDEELRKLFI